MFRLLAVLLKMSFLKDILKRPLKILGHPKEFLFVMNIIETNFKREESK